MRNLLAQLPPPEPQEQGVTLTPGGTEASQFTEPTNFTVSQLLSFAITATLIVAGVIFFFMLIIGGIQWMTAGGDKANTEGARNRITFALIGLVIVFSAFAIINLLSSVFGVDLFQLDFGSINATVG